MFHWLDRGAQPFQGFALLTRVRNNLIHFKSNEAFDQNATPEDVHKDLIRKFSNKGILALDMQAGSWTYMLETEAVADWSCKTAARMAVDFRSKAPQGGWRTFLGGIEMNFKPYA